MWAFKKEESSEWKPACLSPLIVSDDASKSVVSLTNSFRKMKDDSEDSESDSYYKKLFDR